MAAVPVYPGESESIGFLLMEEPPKDILQRVF